MFLASTSMMYHHYDAIRGQTQKKHDVTPLNISVKEITWADMKKALCKHYVVDSMM